MPTRSHAPRSLLALLLCVFPAGCGRSPAPVELDSALIAPLAELASRSGIEIVPATEVGRLATSTGVVTWKPVDARDLESYTKLFRTEFALYPPEFLSDVRIRRVCLCLELEFEGQIRMALPEFGTHTLYYDVSALRSGSVYARRVIHHELFHMVDYADDGAVYEDASWCQLNAIGWQYGSGGKNAQDKPDGSLLTDKLRGFVNEYSTSGVEEDKAEIYATVIVDPRTLDMLAAKDEVLVSKLTRMGELLAAASPHAGGTLWKRIYAPVANR